LTYYIYHYSTSEDLQEQQLAWAGAVVLLALVIILNVGIRLLTGKRTFAASQTE
jgi:ABC-type phosphate transport system permease subunit